MTIVDEVNRRVAQAAKGADFLDGQKPRELVVVGIHDFLTRELPPREEILSPWLTTQSLSMIYAWPASEKRTSR